MKNIKSFLGLSLAVAALGFTACDDDDYSATPMPKTDQVYFSNEASTTYLLEENQNEVDIVLSRINTKDELTVTVNATDTSSLFTVAKSVVFAADSAFTTIPVTFNFSDLTADNDYALTLSVSDGCEYADSVLSVVIKFAPWTSWAPYGWEYPKGISTFAEWEEVYVASSGASTSIAKNGELPVFTYNGYYSGSYYQPLFFRQSQLNPSQAQLMLYDWGAGVDYTIDWNMETGALSPASPVYFTNNSTYGAVYIADAYYYYSVVRNNTSVTTADFPHSFDKENGKFTFYIAYYVSAGSFGYGPETLQLPGYTKPDYSVTVKELGCFESGSQLAKALNVTFGADVASIKYVAVPAVSTYAELDSIANLIMTGAMAAESTTEQGDKIVYGEYGAYDFIACMYDNDGNYQGYDFAEFMMQTYETAGTGTFEYWDFFAVNDTTAYVQKDMTLYRCKQNPTAYKIGDWGELGSYTFTMTDSTLMTDEQLVSEDGYYVADVMSPCALYSYAYTWAFVLNRAYKISATYLTASEYSATEGTFYFNNVYFSEDGPYNFGYETFTLSEATAKEVAATRSLNAPYLGAAKYHHMKIDKQMRPVMEMPHTLR